ncbi:MAG: transcriptional repressor [Candidatus Obscuribacterales bacterium]|nr:transcriptional repressor [Candidatus Obscuribacterales bacterium]
MKAVDIETALKSHGVKPTPQRAVIAEFLFSTDCHPTADEVLSAVADRLPVSLSRATVYNTLNTLVEAGVIKEVVTEPGRTRYDAKTTSHHHFVDQKSGRIIDVEPEDLDKLDIKLGGKYRVKNYHITFFGDLEEEAE